MGKYTALDDPIVDQTVEEHMQQIVAAVTSRIEPQAIFLRGSFGRGEGSVVVEGSGLRFLSDYELMVVTSDYRDRQPLQTVARQMTAQLGVETSISRLRPYNPSNKSVARPTISMYELQNGGHTLYGQQLLNQRPDIDPRTLDLWSGLRLLLNRMAESLDRLPQTDKDWEGLRWINKTVLSCAEVLLVFHGRYHFTYAERGRRFADLISELDGVVAQASHLPDLVCRATAFKLRPSLDLYPEPMPLMWDQVKQVCDVTLRHVVKKYLGFSFDSYAEFPSQYLSQLRMQNKIMENPFKPLPAPISQNLLLILKLLRDRRRPPLRLITSPTNPAYQIVFSVVPLAFLEGNDEVLKEARRWLGKVRALDAPRAEHQAEWDYLQASTLKAWKDFCYGMWELI